MHIFRVRHYYVPKRNHWVVDCFDYHNNLVYTKRFSTETEALRFVDEALSYPLNVKARA